METIQDVERQIDALEKKYASKLAVSTRPPGKVFDPAATLERICAVVQIAMPALKLAKKIFFFSKKIQNVIQKIIDIASMACG